WRSSPTTWCRSAFLSRAAKAGHGHRSNAARAAAGLAKWQREPRGRYRVLGFAPDPDRVRTVWAAETQASQLPRSSSHDRHATVRPVRDLPGGKDSPAVFLKHGGSHQQVVKSPKMSSSLVEAWLLFT